MTIDSDDKHFPRRAFELEKMHPDNYRDAEGMKMHQQDSFVGSTGFSFCLNLIVPLKREERKEQF